MKRDQVEVTENHWTFTDHSQNITHVIRNIFINPLQEDEENLHRSRDVVGDTRTNDGRGGFIYVPQSCSSRDISVSWYCIPLW